MKSIKDKLKKIKSKIVNKKLSIEEKSEIISELRNIYNTIEEDNVTTLNKLNSKQEDIYQFLDIFFGYLQSEEANDPEDRYEKSLFFRKLFKIN